MIITLLYLELWSHLDIVVDADKMTQMFYSYTY